MSNRTYWACEAVGIAPEKSAAYTVIHGVQSVGMTASFNLQQVFEIGELKIYENVEDIPEVEVTIEKVLDGHPLVFHEATQGATAGTLAGRSNQRCNLALSIFSDTGSAASGIPTAEVNCSGLYLSSVTYTLPTEGWCTESVTLVGNHRVWRTAAGGSVTNPTFSGNLFTNTDAPLSATGVQRRENVKFGSLLDGTVTLLPSGTGGVRGISASGTNDQDADGNFGAHVSSITVRADLGRDAIFELGRRKPYFRFISWPVEVTTDIETIPTEGDFIDAREEAENLTDNRILIVLDDSTKLDLGGTNKLNNITYGGGDAGDNSNVTCTYSYTTFNDLSISASADPG